MLTQVVHYCMTMSFCCSRSGVETTIFLTIRKINRRIFFRDNDYSLDNSTMPKYFKLNICLSYSDLHPKFCTFATNLKYRKCANNSEPNKMDCS